MGNCIIKESSMQWGGEDWSTSFARESDFSNRTRNRRYFYAETERTSLLGVSSSPKAAGSKVVKIRVSKKQLSDLLKNADMEGLSAQEVLARLTEAGDQLDAHRALALTSIPE
ncbi:uncharacterized protein [Primulina eburnea]|uniref:uncharacterized protein n=1 Tax=Primulina eburnea TaxID=1245227 RepID=UPI003C6C7A24